MRSIREWERRVRSSAPSHQTATAKGGCLVAAQGREDGSEGQG